MRWIFLPCHDHSPIDQISSKKELELALRWAVSPVLSIIASDIYSFVLRNARTLMQDLVKGD